jgi:putative MFS transporter
LTTNLIGYVVGAYLLGTMSDLIGRRPAFLTAAILVSIGSLLTAATMNALWLDVWRFVTGIGIGAEIALAATYVGEIAPRAVRARYNAWANVWAISGLCLVPFIALALVPHFEWGWRALYLLGALGGLAAVAAPWILPESPRWLLSKGRTSAAEAIVAAAERVAVRRHGGPLPKPAPVAAVAPSGRFPSRELLRRPYLGRLVLWIGVWFFHYVADYGWLGLGPALLQKQGFTLSSTYTFLLLTSIGGLVGVLSTTLFLVDRVDRKVIACGSPLLWAVGMLVIGFFPQPVTISVGVFITAFGMMSGTTVSYLYTAEHFPTRARTTGTALTDGLGHLGGAVSAVLVLGVYDLVGFAGAFAFQAGCLILASLLVARFALRSSNQSLEALSC